MYTYAKSLASMNLFAKFTSFLITLFYLQQSYAIPSNLRLIGNGEMTKEMTLAFEADSMSNAKVYFDIVNHGTNLNGYANKQPVDESYLLMGMQSQIIRLKNLQPDTRYYFVVADNNGTTAVHYFETLPGNSQPLSIIAGGCSIKNRSIRINANKMVAKLLPHAVLFTGDFTDVGTYTQWDNWFSDWTYSFSHDGRITPIIPARGNHEANNDFLTMFFGIPSSGYYSTRLNDLLSVYSLNSEDYVTDYNAQTFWLEQRLSNENTRYKIVQYHKAIRPHTSLKSEGDVQYSYWPGVFEKYNVNLVIEGDATTIKQTWPIVSCTGGLNCEMGFKRDDENGIVYVGEGGWGSPIKTPDDIKAWTRDANSANQFKWIFVEPDKIDVRTVIYDNVVIVDTLNYSNRFTLPQNLQLWNPPNGNVIEIPYKYSDKPQLGNQYPYIDQTFVHLNPINLSVDAKDLYGVITKISFFINNTLINTDFAPPYQYNNWVPPGFGNYELTTLATNNTGDTATLATTFQVVQSYMVGSSKIKNKTNDAEEYANGKMDLFNWDLDFGYNGYSIGLRFTNINIPPEAIVTKAYLQLTSDEIKSVPTKLNIKAQKSVNAKEFKLDNGNISSRPLIQNSVDWKVDNWFVISENGIAQRSPDLSNMLNEIIGLPGYNFSTPIVLIVTGSGHRVGESTDGELTKSPVLYYEYYIKNPNDCATEMIIDQHTNLKAIPLLCKSISTSGSLIINQPNNNYQLSVSDGFEFNDGFEIHSNCSFIAEIKSCQ